MFQYLLLLETDEEREFFTEIYEKYQNDMFRIANGILHNSSDAEDMVHETIRFHEIEIAFFQDNCS